MSENTQNNRNTIHLGTHGEDYGNWMSNPVFYMVGALIAIAVVLTFLFFGIFHITVPGIIFAIIAVIFVVLLIWISWVRRQYSFSGGRMMEKVHDEILSELNYDGNGTLLEVGCGSGALSIRAALTWPETKVVGVDYWGAIYNYSKMLCENNAKKEGVAEQCSFMHGDARALELADESVDAVVSNYVYHNITGSDKQELLLETLRVLKKGGVFALNDAMRPSLYGDMDAFAEKLRGMGYEEVRFVDTAVTVFGSASKASMMCLNGSKMLVGRK